MMYKNVINIFYSSKNSYFKHSFHVLIKYKNVIKCVKVNFKILLILIIIY